MFPAFIRDTSVMWQNSTGLETSVRMITQSKTVWHMASKLNAIYKRTAMHQSTSLNPGPPGLHVYVVKLVHYLARSKGGWVGTMSYLALWRDFAPSDFIAGWAWWAAVTE